MKNINMDINANENALTKYVVINPLTAKLFNWNFHPLEVVSRWRDPQLQVGEIYSYLAKSRSMIEILLISVTFYL